MNTKKIVRFCSEVELLEFVPDLYCIHIEANEALIQLRKGISTWASQEKNREMNISIWVYNDLRVNAFCCYRDGHNYIALSVGIFFEFWKAANEFINHERFSLVFKLAEERKPYILNALFFSMLNFTIAHEFGHIAHGHLRDDSYGNGIDEVLEITGEGNSKSKNWNTQLKEYDADSFAVSIQALLLLQEWSDEIKINIASVDMLFIANYLCFLTFAEKTGRNFDKYMEKDIAEVDHPHPGIRMYYAALLYSYWIGRVKGYNEDVLYALSSGTHAVVAYEKTVVESKKIKECYFSVAFTEKGCQHIMNLNNGWQELVDHYSQYAYIPNEKLGIIDTLPVSVNENGTFLKIKEKGNE